jgi:hypothetical protein
MAGPVPEDTRKVLFEMFHIRNVLAHRAGIADKRFCKQCPWRSEKRGARIMLNYTDYLRFRRSIETYVVELITRDLIRQGRTREEAVAHIKNRFSTAIPDHDGA